MISKEEIIAVAKECNAQQRVYKTSPGLDHFLLETAQLERFANHFYEAGAASRDAEIAELVAALETVIANAPEPYCAITRAVDAQCRAALAKVRKP